MEKKKTSGNISESSEDPTEKEVEEDKNDCEEDYIEDSNTESNTTFKVPKSKQRDNKLTTFQNLLLKRLDNKSNTEDDADKYFLLSLLPDYKKLTDQEKTKFKLMTIQFFDNIQRLKNTQNVCPTNYSTPTYFSQPQNNYLNYPENPLSVNYPSMHVQQPLFSPSTVSTISSAPSVSSTPSPTPFQTQSVLPPQNTETNYPTNSSLYPL